MWIFNPGFLFGLEMINHVLPAAADLIADVDMGEKVGLWDSEFGADALILANKIITKIILAQLQIIVNLIQRIGTQFFDYVTLLLF